MIPEAKVNYTHTSERPYLLAVLLELALDSRVPVILDVVVAPSWQLLGDVGPAVPVVLVHRNQYRFLVVCFVSRMIEREKAFLGADTRGLG